MIQNTTRYIFQIVLQPATDYGCLGVVRPRCWATHRL